MLVRYGGSGCTSVPSSSLLRSPSPSPFLITTISNQEEGGEREGEEYLCFCQRRQSPSHHSFVLPSRGYLCCLCCEHAMTKCNVNNMYAACCCVLLRVAACCCVLLRGCCVLLRVAACCCVLLAAYAERVVFTCSIGCCHYIVLFILL